MSRNLIGIDITDRDVTMVQLRSGRCAVERLHESVVQNGQIVSPETLAAFLKSMKKKHHMSGRECVVILPEAAAFFRDIEMPAISQDQIKLNLPYEFRDYVGGNGGNYHYGYQIVGKETASDGTNMMHILAAAGEKDIVSRYTSIFKRAGLKIVGAVPREIALTNLLNESLKGEKHEGERALIELGQEHTRVSIYNGSVLSGYKVIDLGCATIDEAIAEKMDIDQFIAAEYRDSNFEQVLSSQEVKLVYSRISLEIMKAFNFYRYEHQDSEVTEVRLIGPGAMIKDLKETILIDIDAGEREALDLLPLSLRDKKEAVCCAIAAGAVMTDPTKKGNMNLYVKEVNGNSLSRVIPTALLLIMLVAAFTKFLVLDRIAAVDREEAEMISLRGQLQEMNEQLLPYDEVEEEYFRYTITYKNDEEQLLDDRLEMLAIVKEKAQNLAEIRSVSITGNTMQLSIRAASLDDIAKLREIMEADERVISMTMYSAVKDKSVDGGTTVEGTGVIEFNHFDENGVIEDMDAGKEGQE